MRDRGDYYKEYAARRRELDRQRRASPEGKREQLRIRNERLEAIKRATMMGEFDILVREEAKLLCKTREKETGILWDPDHMLPLRAKTVSGLDCAGNIQVIPAKLNRSKKNKVLYTERGEWLRDFNIVCK